jgi:hypothetical protein
MEPHPANDKLREAEFFFVLMQQHSDRYGCKYFLNAFLAALYSCAEHNRLCSKDPRFKDWYRRVKETSLSDPELQRLKGLRDKEIHQKGTESFERIGMSFPEGIETTELALEFDFRSGTPVGRYKSAGMETPQEWPVEQCWVWDADGDPDVMECCRKGLDIMRGIIDSRDAMEFVD